MFSSLFKGVGKAVKGVVKGVKKVVKKTADFTKKALKNKYVRAGLLITAAVMLPGAIAAIGPASGALAVGTLGSGALVGGIIGAGAGVLAGKKPKEWLASGAIGAATGAAFAKISQSVKGISNLEAMEKGQVARVETLNKAIEEGKKIPGIQDLNEALQNQQDVAASFTENVKVADVVKEQAKNSLANVTSGSENTDNPFDWKEAATQAGITAGVQTGVGVVQQQIADATTDEPVTFGSRGVNNMFDSYRRGVAQLTGNYLASGMSSGSNTAQIYGDLVNSLAYGNGTADYGQMAGVSLLNGVEVPGLQYTV